MAFNEQKKLNIVATIKKASISSSEIFDNLEKIKGKILEKLGLEENGIDIEDLLIMEYIRENKEEFLKNFLDNLNKRNLYHDFIKRILYFSEDELKQCGLSRYDIEKMNKKRLEIIFSINREMNDLLRSGNYNEEEYNELNELLGLLNFKRYYIPQ